MRKKSLSSILIKSTWDKIQAWQEQSDYIQQTQNMLLTNPNFKYIKSSSNSKHKDINNPLFIQQASSVIKISNLIDQPQILSKTYTHSFKKYKPKTAKIQSQRNSPINGLQKQKSGKSCFLRSSQKKKNQNRQVIKLENLQLKFGNQNKSKKKIDFKSIDSQRRAKSAVLTKQRRMQTISDELIQKSKRQFSQQYKISKENTQCKDKNKNPENKQNKKKVKQTVSKKVLMELAVLSKLSKISRLFN